MFGSFRKHQKWIWLLGVIVIIPSFVIFFSPNVDFDKVSAGKSYDLGSIEGRRITRDEYVPFYNEARLAHFVRAGGRWPGTDEATQNRLEGDALSRLLLVRKLKELSIYVSDVAVARMAQRQLRDYPLNRFVTEVLRPQGFTESDYHTFLRHETGVQQLASVAGLSGKLVNPREAEMLFRKEYQNIHVDAAVFWISNYLDKVTVTPEGLTQFYTNRLQVYREPDRIQVSYVAFVATNYFNEADQKLAAITNFNERIDEFYRQRGADSFKDTNGVVLSEDAAKTKIREDLRRDYALQEAEIRANRFGGALLERPQPNRAEDLKTVADALGVTVQETPPFSANKGLEEMDFPPTFQQQAMQLSTNNPIRVEPIVGKNGACIIAFKNEIKGENPSFEQIRNKVTEDYKQQKAREMAGLAGQSFYRTLTNGLAQGKTFAELCQQSNVKREELPLFSPSSRPPLEGWDNRFNLAMAQRFTEDLEPGQVSPFSPTRDGGYILHLLDRSPVDESRLQKELPEFTANLRQYRLGQAFDQWFRKQAEHARLSSPRRTSEVGPDQGPAAGGGTPSGGAAPVGAATPPAPSGG